MKKRERTVRAVAQKKITVSLSDVLSPQIARSSQTTPKSVTAAPVVTNWFVALFDFSGDPTYHMMSSLIAGDVVRIIRKGATGWWWANQLKKEKDGQVQVHEGYVPADYLKPVTIEKAKLIEPPETSTAPQSTPSYSVEVGTRTDAKKTSIPPSTSPTPPRTNK